MRCSLLRHRRTLSLALERESNERRCPSAHTPLYRCVHHETIVTAPLGLGRRAKQAWSGSPRPSPSPPPPQRRSSGGRRSRGASRNAPRARACRGARPCPCQCRRTSEGRCGGRVGRGWSTRRVGEVLEPKLAVPQRVCQRVVPQVREARVVPHQARLAAALVHGGEVVCVERDVVAVVPADGRLAWQRLRELQRLVVPEPHHADGPPPLSANLRGGGGGGGGGDGGGSEGPSARGGDLACSRATSAVAPKSRK